MEKEQQILERERLDRFENKWLPKFKERFGDYIKQDVGAACWHIKTGPDQHSFYPKSNKVFHHSSNTWTEQGLKYLIKNYLK